MADLAVNDLALRHGVNDVLRGIALSVPAGTVVVLLGPSGSGKTALVRAVAGLETPHRGSIAIGETVLFDRSRHIDLAPEARRLGLVSQPQTLWPHRSVFGNVAYGLRLRRLGPDAIRTRVEAALSRFGIADLAHRHPQQLSGEQQQRVALARALVYEPAAVLLDEPFANVDPKARAAARAWLRQLILSLNIPALLVTRDPIEAMAIADRIVLINAGAVEQQGTPTDLYREPATLFAAEFMGNNNRLDGTLVELVDKRAVIEVMGLRLEGVARTEARVGGKATGIIRVERMMLGGGPGPNRIPMTLKSQMYVGERWEVLFVKDALAVRAYASAPLKYEFYHAEFPPPALWVFASP
jgi:iron(III) transport system ATP-binding protein